MMTPRGHSSIGEPGGQFLLANLYDAYKHRLIYLLNLSDRNDPSSTSYLLLGRLELMFYRVDTPLLHRHLLRDRLLSIATREKTNSSS